MKKLFFILLCIFIETGVIFSTTGTDTDFALGADVSIQFYNQSIYYPGDSSSEPIYIQLTISNNGTEPVRFKIADDHFFSIDFSAVNTRNRALDHTEFWVRKRTTSSHIYFRELSVEPGESYSVIENLKDYVSITQPGIYLIECEFFPELKRNITGESYVTSNKLTLEVKPSPGPAAVRILPLSSADRSILQAQSIPPDQVIDYILSARQKSQWDQFFLYLDLEQMLSRDPVKGRKFRNESEAGRLQMIENYKTELSQATVDRDISTIPVDYTIERTTYTDTKGTVTVIQWFDYRTFRERKRYTYYLGLKDDIWRVYDYTVDNLGTE
ncbi:hypothetical protein K7I13_00475 [Brucepastera parasyntrophica]|uniref:hypothetical protein n=1 Tax=Brucepastera parasyntrophica TaxID=2880008 RepID=UPI00210D5F3B|nr:hypothetical protein [Brucepastera parasyntrophica]ULQ59866.1 hypothetical protein K7I13_00475 [Brucepastera parasyntrophica]